MIARHGSGTPRAASSRCSRRPGLPIRGAAPSRAGHRSRGLQPDGTKLVTASDDRTARLWDAASGGQLAVLHGHEDQVWWAAFSPDGAKAVTASSDRSARLWDAPAGNSLAVLQGHEKPCCGHVQPGRGQGGDRARPTARRGSGTWWKPHGLRAGRTRRHGPNGAVRPERSADHHGFPRCHRGTLGQRGRPGAGAARASRR